MGHSESGYCSSPFSINFWLVLVLYIKTIIDVEIEMKRKQESYIMYTKRAEYLVGRKNGSDHERTDTQRDKAEK